MGAMHSVALSPLGATPSRCGPLRGGSRTATGHRRSVNEDAAACGPTWFAVADGVGGQAAGDVASRETIDAVRQQPAPVDVSDLHAVVATATDRVRAAARGDGVPGMGTTLVAAAAFGDGVAIVHIGDSRCYRLVGGVLTQLTRDHSHVQELLDLGHISPAEAQGHRYRHVVTRVIGADTPAPPDLFVLHGPVGRLLLCTDGLSAELAPRTLGRVLAGVPDPQAAADRLVELALLGGARDDVTAVVVDHDGANR